MRTVSRTLLLCCVLPLWVLALGGCGVAALLNSLESPPVLTGNWQIQSAAGASTTQLPTAGLLLLGSLTSQGTAVTGTFRLANLSVPNSCGTPLAQIVTVTGTVDNLGNLSLTSVPFSGSVLTAKLVVPSVLTNFGAGTIAIAGGSCTFASSAAIGAQIAPLSGSYTGTVTAGTVPTTPPITSGTATLTLTQAASPNADGQYGVTGTLGFVGGGCTGSTAVSGTVSGLSLTLASPPTQLGISQDQMAGVVLPNASQITAGEILYGLGPCNTGVTALGTYSGTLNHQ